MINFWKCSKCNELTDKLIICWNESGGLKVDMQDYFCPNCGSTHLKWMGTKEERNNWWEKEWKSNYLMNRKEDSHERNG